MPPADVVDDVDGESLTTYSFFSKPCKEGLSLIVAAVNMDEEDDADQEQRLINEGTLPFSINKSRPKRELTAFQSTRRGKRTAHSSMT
jgi:negative regulator of sigma E activity